MSVMYLILPAALLMAGAAVWAFIRSARDGQYDDLDTPPLRVLLDDEPEPMIETQTSVVDGAAGTTIPAAPSTPSA